VVSRHPNLAAADRRLRQSSFLAVIAIAVVVVVTLVVIVVASFLRLKEKLSTNVSNTR
jgi:Tfp pilus assembly protein PilX